MRADLALIGFILTLAGGITLLVLRRRRGGVPLLPRSRCIWRRRFCWCWQSGSSVCEKRRKMT